MDAEQQLVFNTASRNPTKKLLCEGPQLRTIQPYDSQGEAPSPRGHVFRVLSLINLDWASTVSHMQTSLPGKKCLHLFHLI